jgi:hypothetical protein
MNISINNFCSEDECIKIYDVEKKELIGVYPTYKKAEIATGLNPKVLRGAIKSKTRRFSPILKKEIAIRIGAKIKP